MALSPKEVEVITLVALGYSDKETDAIIKYAVGAASFSGAPFINHQTLSEKGFIAEEIKKSVHGKIREQQGRETFTQPQPKKVLPLCPDRELM